VFLRTGRGAMNSYLESMIRSAPPAPIKTALLTLLIAAVIALAIAAHG
jgi:hypothetical protein